MHDLGIVPGYVNSAANGINNRGQVVGYAAVADGSLWDALLWRSGTVRELDRLVGTDAIANAIDDSGQVVGTAPDVDFNYHGFLLSHGRVVNLGDLPGGPADMTNSYALGIDDQGHIVGYADLAEGGSHALLWREGVIQDLGTLGGPYSFGYAVVNHIQ